MGREPSPDGYIKALESMAQSTLQKTEWKDWRSQSTRMSSVKVSHRNGCTNTSRTIKEKEKMRVGETWEGLEGGGMRGTGGRKGKGK